ncbi:hypothetical protein Pla110_02570 [Polystyrenella longa]|uniref:DUF1501 domain-containing protein n=1 Tax=Polystyrenella longa TaxID=2528007 RepID=A0A518CH54_9PLAN|nr:DUF1501 domain-containing protein [Polystyrenella longa]QDU78553.1 hypothetical protein Pla110_02570 [Polystyrenella longa]
MFRIDGGRTPGYCDGLTRRNFLQLGVAGMGSVGMSRILQAKAATEAAGGTGKKTSVILLWLDGGPGHLDTYDMKPEAPSEFRGIWNPIPTNVPGFEMTELFPLQAKIADKFSIVRSLQHGTGDHFAGAHRMLTTYPGTVSGANKDIQNPSIGSVAARMVGARNPGMPPYVAVPYAASVGLRPGYFGSTYVGDQYNPFDTGSDPNKEGFKVQNLNVTKSLSLERLEDRRHLQKTLDNMQRKVDQSGMLAAMDEFDQQAFNLVTGPRAREAFDIDSEDPTLRDKYGRNSFGQSVLLARRLVEAGTTFVTCHFGGWDHHWDLQKGMDNYLPRVDSAVSALFNDLTDRGLYDDVLVVMCGEFSRTPRMNNGGNGGPALSMGTPGRDHWGNAMFCLMGGGGVRGGQLIGATDRKGERPIERVVGPGDIHHTIYRVLGIDPSVAFLDHSGRPVYSIGHGDVIDELL